LARRPTVRPGRVGSDPQPTCGYGKPGTTRPGFPFAWNCDSTAGAAGWYGSVADVGRFLAGLRDHKVLSAATTDMMYKELLGWDTSEPGWEKNGGWFWNEGAAPAARAGAFRSSIFHFPDDGEAVMFINSDTDNLPETVLRLAWTQSMQEALAVLAQALGKPLKLYYRERPDGPDMVLEFQP
jgi:Beta-lactamase